jgi:hypothetical protein
MARHFVGRRRRAGGIFEEQSAGIKNDIMLKEEIEEEARHIQ